MIEEKLDRIISLLQILVGAGNTAEAPKPGRKKCEPKVNPPTESLQPPVLEGGTGIAPEYAQTSETKPEPPKEVSTKVTREDLSKAVIQVYRAFDKDTAVAMMGTDQLDNVPAERYADIYAACVAKLATKKA